jgi:hypothetical protein
MMRTLVVCAISWLAVLPMGPVLGETGMHPDAQVSATQAPSAPRLAQADIASDPEPGQAADAKGSPDKASADKASADKAAQDKLAAPAPPPHDPRILKANTWTVGLASGLPEGAFIRFGAEIARNLNDGDKLRVMPLITSGATGNVADLLYLKGVDVALTNADVLEHFRSVEKLPDIERKVQYIAGMYITHLHVLVRGDIASLKDL